MGRRYADCSSNELRAARGRRAKLRKAKLCINGATHGLATHGCRCHHCFDVHNGIRPYDAAPIARITREEASEILRRSEASQDEDVEPLRRTG